VIPGAFCAWFSEGFLDATVDRVQVDAEGGQQLGVAGLGAWERASRDQPVDLGPDGHKVQAMAAQQVTRGVVAVGNRIIALGQQPKE
jgi:hypothetical protein